MPRPCRTGFEQPLCTLLYFQLEVLYCQASNTWTKAIRVRPPPPNCFLHRDLKRRKLTMGTASHEIAQSASRQAKPRSVQLTVTGQAFTSVVKPIRPACTRGEWLQGPAERCTCTMLRSMEHAKSIRASPQPLHLPSWHRSMQRYKARPGGVA